MDQGTGPNYLILPLTKSPHSTGRVGPVIWQDWYRGCVKAKSIQNPDADILVISDIQIAGERHEVDLYVEALNGLGATSLIIVREAQETIEQIKVGKRIAEDRRAKLVVISTFFHYPRVRWVCRGLGFCHRVVFGMPRPREAFTDLILTFLFPVIDLMGLREKFLERVKKRRFEGKH